MRIKTKFILSMAGAFILGIILTGSFCKFTMGDGTAGFNSDSKFDEIKSYIDAYYLNDYEDQDLKEGAYRGYVEGLGDPYSNYMTESEVETWEIETTGSYSGVGMTFSTDYENGFRVFSVVEDSPAEKAGVVEGDHILGVDGEKYTDGDKMASNIRGKEGTEVTVTISHDGKVKDYTMVREEIVQKSVSHKMGKDKIGYIEIDSFIDSTDEDFKSALDDLERQGAKALVLDLRNNGGGLVNEAVNVADEFLDKGVVCYVEDKNGKTETYNAVDGKTKLKTVVLVNENSASA
ncbi:MAG: S41 family peptidase, partial [Bacillota bacterium]|nr:S41 family peptidase [Bacillota bacterium]